MKQVKSFYWWAVGLWLKARRAPSHDMREPLLRQRLGEIIELTMINYGAYRFRSDAKQEVMRAMKHFTYWDDDEATFNAIQRELHRHVHPAYVEQRFKYY
jgi:hypothetical protein